MLVSVVSKYLQSHKRLVVPQLGAFIVKEPGCVLFTELLKRDDGVLRGLLRDRGVSDLESAGEIDRFVFEVRHAVEHGETYPLPGFGAMHPGPNETIAFSYDPEAYPVAPEPQPAGVQTAADGGQTASEPLREAPADGERSGTQPSARNTGPAPDSGRARDARTPRDTRNRRGTGPARPHAAMPPAGKERPGTSAPASETPDPRVSLSVKLNPEPYVKGLRYGKPLHSTDAYRYVDKAPRRRIDRFVLIALAAVLIAAAAIAYGYWRETAERRAETDAAHAALTTPLPETSAAASAGTAQPLPDVASATPAASGTSAPVRDDAAAAAPQPEQPTEE